MINSSTAYTEFFSHKCMGILSFNLPQHFLVPLLLHGKNQKSMVRSCTQLCLQVQLRGARITVD